MMHRSTLLPDPWEGEGGRMGEGNDELNVMQSTHQVIEDTSCNGIPHKLRSLTQLPTERADRSGEEEGRTSDTPHLHVGLVSILKGGHCSKGSGAHGDIGQLVCGAVSMNCVEVGSGAVHSSHDKIRSNVALVLEQVLLQHPQSSHHTRLEGEREREKVGGKDGS